MSKFFAYGWQLAAAGLLLVGVYLSKGGLAPLMVLGRFLIPIAIVYGIYRVVRGKIEKVAGGALQGKLQAMMEAMAQQQQQQGAGGPGMRGGPGRQQEKVIDLCPSCGSYLAPGHRCKK